MNTDRDADQPADDTLACPTCSAPMDAGWLALWNPRALTKVRWLSTRPGWSRFFAPKTAAIVLQARVGGKDPRIAHRCASCTTVVVPPDNNYGA